MTPSDLREKVAAMTPGAWFLDNENRDDLQGMSRFGHIVVYAIEDCAIHPIADLSCNHTCRTDDEQEANARGIAATHNVAGLLIDLWEAVKWQGCPTAVTACEHPVCIALEALSRVEVDRG